MKDSSDSMKNKTDRSRIIGENVNISGDDVRKFFDGRASGIDQKDESERYTSVLLQDGNSELASNKDRKQKQFLSDKFDFTGSYILDIGCGVGRLASFFCKEPIKGYVGVDFSSNLIQVAKKSVIDDKIKFCSGSFQEITDVLKKNGMPLKYDFIIINGVFMYINDEELDICFDNLIDLSSEKTVIYIKESIGLGQRFTLRNYDSKELMSKYSAIYRSVEEWEEMIETNFDDGWSLSESGFDYETRPHDHKETSTYYWIITRKR